MLRRLPIVICNLFFRGGLEICTREHGASGLCAGEEKIVIKTVVFYDGSMQNHLGPRLPEAPVQAVHFQRMEKLASAVRMLRWAAGGLLWCVRTGGWLIALGCGLTGFVSGDADTARLHQAAWFAASLLGLPAIFARTTAQIVMRRYLHRKDLSIIGDF